MSLKSRAKPAGPLRRALPEQTSLNDG